MGCSILTACGPGTLADSAPEYGAGPDLRVWAADSALAGWVELAAVRIERASGLRVVVEPDVGGDAIPLFWMDRDDVEWWGFAHVDAAARPTYLTVSTVVPGYMLETVVLHELLHGLGAHHVGQDLGVMSPEAARPYSITDVDLESLCTGRADRGEDCPTFTPEK